MEVVWWSLGWIENIRSSGDGRRADSKLLCLLQLDASNFFFLQTRQPSRRPQPQTHALEDSPVSRSREDLVDQVSAPRSWNVGLLRFEGPYGSFASFLPSPPLLCCFFLNLDSRRRKLRLTGHMFCTGLIFALCCRAGEFVRSLSSTPPPSPSPTPFDNLSSSSPTPSTEGNLNQNVLLLL